MSTNTLNNHNTEIRDFFISATLINNKYAIDKGYASYCNQTIKSFIYNLPRVDILRILTLLNTYMRTIKNNKKGLFDYEISDTIDAGIILAGHEVKSIKLGNFQLSDSHIKIDHLGNLMLYNMNVPRYAFTSPAIIQGYNPKQGRQLLITKQQRSKLYATTRKSGLVMIPVRIRESKTGFIKVTVGLAKRKKKIQKRSIIKDRDTARQMDKAIKNLK